MNLQEAFSALENGAKVKLPEWTGHWFESSNPDNYKLPIEERILVFAKNGDIYDTPWIEKYKDRTDFEITDGAMGFDFAILAIENGKKVARAGWNGNNQWVVIMHPGNDMFTNSGSGYPMQKCIGLKNTSNNIQPGWTPSQGDLFAKDWIIIP